jgi:rSAM/selenodomain-associated transferase 1
VSDRTLAVFVKEPQPGRVKTRLAAVLGDEDAAHLYRALAENVLAATTPKAGEYERLVFFDPPDAGERLRAWLPAGRLRRQAAGDLGSRMVAAFARCFERGATRVTLVGTDVPALDGAVVRSAFEALEANDVVFGPAADGGYYLVALRGPQPFLFESVAWSTPAVLEQTAARAAAAGLQVGRLPPLRDLDTVEDLRAEWPLVERLLGACPSVRDRIARALDVGVPGRPA